MRVVGKVVRDRPGEAFVATKGGVAWEFTDGGLSIWREASGDYLRMSLDRSLGALGLDHVDLYQVHWPVPGVPPEDTMRALVELQQAGKIRYFGVSNYAARELDAAYRVAPFVSYQPG